MPKRRSTFDVVYQQVGRAPEGGLAISTPEDGFEASLPPVRKTSIFGGKGTRSIFSIDKASIFSFQSNLSTKLKASLSLADSNEPRGPKASSAHSFHEDYASDGTDGDESDDDSDADTASTVTVGRARSPSPVPLPTKAEADVPEKVPMYEARRRTPGRFLHSLNTPNNRIQLVLESIGAKDRPIYVEGIAANVNGKVLVPMQREDEEITVEVRGIAYSEAIVGGFGTSKGEVSYLEEQFFESSQMLWSSESGPPRPGQLQEFLFSVQLPKEVPSSGQQTKRSPMPPTFAMEKHGDAVVPGFIPNAFISYEVKISVSQRNMMRTKERLFAPFVYLSQNQDLSFLSQPRRHALMQKTILPYSPDTKAWHCHREVVTFDKGLFSSVKNHYEVEIFIPAPTIYGRQETLPVHIHITSKEIKQLNKLGLKSMEIVLMQKLTIRTLKAAGRREEVMDDATVSQADGVELKDNGEGIVKYSGQLEIRKAGVTTFDLAKMQLQYHIMCGFTVPNQLIYWISVPITVINIPALYEIP